MTPTEPTALSTFDAQNRDEPAKGRTLWHWLSKVGGVLSGLPESARCRLVILFLGLAAIKLILLFDLSKHLFESHWRVEQYPGAAWGDYVAAGIFVTLGVLSLWRLGRYCERVGRASVRVANLVVICLGCVFIFLTFHNGDNNFIFPVLTHVLGWTNLWPYLANDLFFNSPFLAAWLCGYALGYYALVRSGRESWALYLTAVFAAAYSPLLFQDFARFHYELLLLDCLGAIALVAGWNPVRRIAAGWLLLPLGWVLLGSGQLLWVVPEKQGWPRTYFLALVAGALLLFGSSTILAAKCKFSACWTRLVLFYAAAFVLLANAHFPLASNFGRALCLGFEWPRYFLGETLVCLMLALAAATIYRLWPKAPCWWLDVLSIGLMAIALVDLRLSQILGVRLDWDLLALGNSPKMMWRMARPYVPIALVWMALFALGYMLVLSMAKRRRQTNPDRGCPGPSVGYGAVVFLSLGLLGVLVANSDKGRGQTLVRLAQTSPLWKRVGTQTLSAEAFHRSADELGLGDLRAHSANPPLRQRGDLNVVVVFMESSYNKHLSLFGGEVETQPLLSQYRDQMELFPNFFSAFPSSIHARFASFTSLYPVRDFNAFTLRRVGVKSIFELLHERGYACSLFYSSFLDFTGFREFLANRGIDELYDADTMPGQRKTEPVSWGLREEETLGAMRAQLKKYAASHQRFFLTYVPAAPHYPYEKVSEKFHKFKPLKVGDFTPLYLNELLYMDWVMASLLDELKESHLLEDTLVVITDDHGEMLGADGGPIGHGWALTPELANAPLIIMDPRKTGYRINPVIGSQVDLLPTMLDRLGVPVPADELYEGRSLDAPLPAMRRIYLNSYQEYAVILGNQMFFGDREKQGRGAAQQCFTISNEGAKTVFSPVDSTNLPPSGINQFDKFQENLLQNYSYYRGKFCKDVPAPRTPIAAAR